MSALDRAYSLIAVTLAEDEKDDEPGTPKGYAQGFRAARAEMRQRLTDALAFSPEDPFCIEVAPEWQGIFVTHGRGLMTQLGDDGGSTTPSHLTTVERRIMIARLRAWADEMTPDEVEAS